MAGTKISQAAGDLVLNRVSKFYGDFAAVDDLSLTVPDGSFFALLGPSGCGKTTTLRMIAGLEEPTQGTIQIGPTDITTEKPYRRNVNTVFQNYALFPHLSIFENVAFGLRRRGIKDVKEEVEKALNLVELGHLSGRKPSQLSGGQQQRIAVARAIVNKPALLLLDEPEDIFEKLVIETQAEEYLKYKNSDAKDSMGAKLVTYESVPRFRKRPGDIALEGSNNTLIVLGTDRKDDLKKTDFKESAGTIDIVAGRGQSKKEYGK